MQTESPASPELTNPDLGTAKPTVRADVAFRWSRRVAVDVVGFGDIASVILGSLVPAQIYSSAGNISADWSHLIQASVAAAIIAHLCLRNWDMYDTNRLHDFPISPAALLGALACALVATVGLGIPQPIRAGYLLIWMLTWFSASYTLIVLNRAMARAILARLTSQGYFDERIAVFGAGKIARRVHDYLTDPKLGICFAGLYDDRVDSDRINPDGLTVQGKLEDLMASARSGQIDKIILALPQSAGSRVSQIATKLEHLPVSVHIVTHISSDLTSKTNTHDVSRVGPIGLLDVKRKALADWGPFVKRAEDLVLGGLLLLLSAPILPLIALAIKIESPGPILFRQRRRGFNQEVIEIYKFRSMHVLEDGSNVRQATNNDDRVTKVGRFLRRFSLDELPQLINILKGEMSLVGPRPHALVHDEQFSQMLEHYANRHQVKPGLTGLAQVRGHRGQTKTATSIQARVHADIAYIKNWSLGLDLVILARTIWTVISGKNAH